ncbi:MAG: hypothetical protein HC880_18395 [Bacteroidia bacterium]|nr:hypothetical protein [Bacteroidia bacterium]
MRYFILVILFVQCPLLAQDSDLDSIVNPEELIFKFPHNTFLFNFFASNGEVTRHYGITELQRPTAPGFGFTWLYTPPISEKWGLQVGFSYGLLPLRQKYELKLPPPSSLYDEAITDFVDYLAFPLQLTYRQKLNTCLYFTVHPGISLRYIIFQQLSGSTIL